MRMRMHLHRLLRRTTNTNRRKRRKRARVASRLGRRTPAKTTAVERSEQASSTCKFSVENVRWLAHLEGSLMLEIPRLKARSLERLRYLHRQFSNDTSKTFRLTEFPIQFAIPDRSSLERAEKSNNAWTRNPRYTFRFAHPACRTPVHMRPIVGGRRQQSSGTLAGSGIL